MLQTAEAGGNVCRTCIREIEEENMATDMVNHPAHYGGENDPYEVIKVAEAWGFDGDAYLFQVLKYIRRDKNDELEDLKKARFFLDRKIRRMEETEATHAAALEAPEEFSKYSRYVTVRIYPDDEFNRYGVYAHTEWTIDTLAAVVAVGSNQHEVGTFGISTGREPECKPLRATETVGWMLRNFPPDKFDYYLRKPGV